MSERNEKMAAMLAADAPPARDFAFQIAVTAKIEQRRFRRALTLNLVLTAMAIMVLALVMPAINPALQQIIAGNGLAAALIVAASMALPWWTSRRA